MNFIHRADSVLAKWLDDAAEGKITKKASSVNTVMMPYGNLERASMLSNSVIDRAIEEMQAEENTDKGSSDTSDLEKRIEEAKTPEELEAIEKEIAGASGDAKSEDDAKPEDTPSTPSESDTGDTSSESKPAEDDKADAAPEGGDGDLKKQIEELKKKVEQLSKNDDLKYQVQNLKQKLENIHVNDDPDMNDTINQSASLQFNHACRMFRRIVAKLYQKKAFLTSAQEKRTMELLDANISSSYQQIAKLVAPKVGATEQDVYYFLLTRGKGSHTVHNRGKIK